MRSGLPLTLGAVGVLAVAAALSRSGSRAFGRDGHWGRAGAGVLLTTGKKVLVLLRSEEVTEPGTWNLAGGAVDPGEDALTAGLRELEEETGLEIDPEDAKVQGKVFWQSPTSDFRYTTSVVRVPQSMMTRRVELNWENDAAQWWSAEDLVNHLDDLHPGLRAVLPDLLTIAFDGVLPAVVGPIEAPRRPADAPRAPDSPAFQRWFKDSAVVWADGSPRAVYHSGRRTDFDVFDRTRSADRRPWVKIDTLGSWFASSDQPLYGRSVRGYWLSLQNPKVFAGPGAWRRMYREAEAMARRPGSAWATVYEAQQQKGGFPPYNRSALTRGIEQIHVLPKAAVTRLAKAYGVDLAHPNLPSILWTAIAANAVEDYHAALRRQGHDGIFITGDDFDSAGMDAWIALEPTQIKALDNAGAFDPEDPRVSANRRGSRAATTTPVVLYHGAQRWEGAPEIVAHRKGHAEHGPGIYLTTSHETAARYAKGGGSVYRMELRPGVRWLQDAKLDKGPVLRWLKGLARLRGKEKLVAGVERVTARTGDTFPAEILVNQFVNAGASSGQHGPALAAFLVENGVDASLTSPPMFGGTGGAHGEDWVIVFNPDVLRSVTKVPAREVGKQAPFDLPRVTR